MKKILTVFLVLGLLAGVGTAVFADDNGNEDKSTNESQDSVVSFEDRLPFMQERHPDLTEAELEERFQSCRFNGGPGNGYGYRFSEERDGEWESFREDRSDWSGQGYGPGRGQGMMGRGHGHGMMGRY